MMQYSSYTEYRPSKFDDSVNLPKNWGEKRLKFIASHNDEVLSEKTDPDYVIEYVDISSVNLVSGITQIETLSFESAPSRARRIVRDGDTIISTVRTYLRAITTIINPPDNMVVSTGFAVIRSKGDVDKDYLSYYFQNQGFVDSVVAHSVGVSYPAINASDLVCLPVYFPLSSEDQKHIVRYLDLKTRQIDQLVEKKKALIAKLDEQRVAVITQAVTKGINEVINMRYSGVDWLGNIPEHWKMMKLRFVGECQNGINIGGEYFGRGYPFVSYGDVFNNKELPGAVTGLVDSSENDRKVFSVVRGDIFFTRTSETVEDIAMTSVCMKTLEDAVFAGFLIRFRPTPGNLHEEFSKYFFQNAFLRAFFVKEMNLVTRASLSQDLLRNLPVLIPPLQEQEDIANHLNSQTQRLDKLKCNLQAAIKSLEEYRTSLITAAVSGKIDVRSIEVPQGE